MQDGTGDDGQSDGQSGVGSGANSGGGGALDRYLKRQDGAAETDGGAPSARPTSTPMSASTSIPDLNLSAVPTASYELAGFWRRFGAIIVDGVILYVGNSILLIPLRIFDPFPVPTVNPNDQAALMKMMGAIGATAGLSLISWFAIAFFYYGWFYSQKGATPGKMLLSIKVLDSRTGTHLTYRQAFVREALLKGFVSSTLTLGIGFLMAAFREDHRALHDLIAHTRVVRVRK